MEKAGIEYALFKCDGATYVEVGRFGYRLDAQGRSSGGWVASDGEYWRDESKEWAALLSEVD